MRPDRAVSEPLTHDIEVLAALFKAGGWSELRIETSALSVLLSDDPQASLSAAMAATAAAPAKAVAAAPPLSSTAVDPAWRAVVAPNLGTFYRSPKPGAAPFVEIGQRVTPQTEICLLEVMKLFTSVKAGIAGVIRGIAASDAELVEGGQVLFYLEPE